MPPADVKAPLLLPELVALEDPQFDVLLLFDPTVALLLLL